MKINEENQIEKEIMLSTKHIIENKEESKNLLLGKFLLYFVVLLSTLINNWCVKNGEKI